MSSIPPLKTKDGSWALTPAEKAALLAKTFAEKCQLPPPPEHQPVLASPTSELSGFLLLRARWVKRILKNIDPDKATGPDGLPGKLLKECAEALAPCIARLCRRLVQQGVWPDMWRDHWIHPLYKKGAHSHAGNYRGVHLTPVLSKVVERAIGRLFLPFLERSGAYGANQWAFRPGHSCRDLVTLRVLTWILAAHRGKKTGLFLSDISGAFDRVDVDILMGKFRRAGLGYILVRFLADFFKPRRAQVIVQGAASAMWVICNQVYQGTVLGPPSWSVFFSDVAEAVIEAEHDEDLFADDLTCEKSVLKDVPDDDVFKELRECQARVHAWGVANRVQFDPKKEEFKIMHPRLGWGHVPVSGRASGHSAEDAR